MISVIFLGIAGLAIALIIVLGVVQSKANEKLPVISVHARVIAKRMYVSNSTTLYYVTFEGEAGERQEVSLPGKEFGLLIEGDAGILSQKGARFKSFQRQAVAVSR